MKEKFFGFTKKVSPLYVFEDECCYKRIAIFFKKVLFVDTLIGSTNLRNTVVP